MRIFPVGLQYLESHIWNECSNLAFAFSFLANQQFVGPSLQREDMESLA
jgi:hypothetical protein